MTKNRSKSIKKSDLKNLDILFNPKNVAIIGASRDPKSVGFGIVRNLKKGCAFKCKYCRPFPGKIYPVNPNAKNIDGFRCYPNLQTINDDIDLAIISVNAKLLPLIMKDVVLKKVKVVIIISAGFAELGDQGKKIQEEIVKIAIKAGVRIVGPNCLGIIRPCSSLNASFAPTMPPDGDIAFISQSGALADSIIDWAVEARYGFSAVISVGNKADLDFPDFLEWLAEDKQTKAITMYVEGVEDGRRFMEIARKVSLKKPVILLKAGRTDSGSAAIASHTGSLAGSYEIFKMAMNQSGVIVADSVEEMFDLAKALANQPSPKENSIAIVTNAGGAGVLAADYCELIGIQLAKLSERVFTKIDKSGKMHPAYSRSNPLDIIGDALSERYEVAVNLLLQEDNVAGLIVIQTLQTMTESEKDALVIIDAHKRFPDKPIISTYMGGKFSRSGAELLEENGIPDYNDPLKAAKAMKVLIDRGVLLKKK